MTKFGFTEIVADYIDSNDVLHLDAYGESDEGVTVAYVFNGCVYYTNPEYQYDSLVRRAIDGLQLTNND